MELAEDEQPLQGGTIGVFNSPGRSNQRRVRVADGTIVLAHEAARATAHSDNLGKRERNRYRYLSCGLNSSSKTLLLILVLL